MRAPATSKGRRPRVSAAPHSEHCGSCTGGGTDLEIDVLNVVLDGASREHQPFRDFGVGQAAGDQPQHLHLPLGEICRAGAPSSVGETGGLNRRRDSVGVEPTSPGFCLQPIGGSCRDEAPPVRTILDQSSVNVCRGKHARRHC
jgi:hypothetical protein